MSNHVLDEIHSQPEVWARAAALGAAGRDLPGPGERVAVIGCGTSWFMAMCYAVLRESAGLGWTDAFTATELPPDRAYDRVLAVTRSGTTTEVLEALAVLRGRTPTVAITGDPDTPIAAAADALVALDFADERSVVQTRFATSVLALLRASLGEDIAPVVEDAREALDRPVEGYLAATQVSFLGNGWTVGLAHEAALKMREAAQAWTESYPAAEYRHGPVSVAEAGRLTWLLGAAPTGLEQEVTATGATFVHHADLDPMAALIVAQRTAVALALRRGLDPDQPRNLTRSVILASRLILTVTLNAALDVTYRVDEVRPDASHRVREVHERAGGKGINVARVLHGQGRDATCLGLVGGWTGARIAADLDGAGIAAAMSSVAGESRRTVSVVSAATGGSTLFNEPGPSIEDSEWQAFLSAYARFVPHMGVVVLAGSLPPGVPEDAYAELSRTAHVAGARVIVDADGRVLARSLGGTPEVVKPNTAELRAATGVEAAEPAMRALLEAGAGAVVATFGAEGIRAVTPDGAWTARLETAVTDINPTGAGDAVAAALAAGLEDGRDWPATLADAVAWSAAAVVAPLAGDLDADVLASVRSSVRVEPA